VKKALEAALVAAALISGFCLLYSWRARREAAAHPPRPVVTLGSDPGTGGAKPARGVSALPLLRLSRRPKPRPAAAVPPPASGS
jgi:hypothetical protein